MIFRRKSSRAYTEAREKVSAVNADLQENVAGLRVAQAYRREQVNSNRFAGLSGAYRKSRLRAQRMIAVYFPFVQALSTVAGAVILFAAASEVHNNALTAGSLIAYLLWVDQLFSPIQQMSQVFDGYQQANVGLQRIKGLLQTPTSTPPAADPVRPGRLRGADRAVAVFSSATPGSGFRPFAGSTCRSRPARPWRWSARPAPESRRWSSSSHGFTTSPRAGC